MNRKEMIAFINTKVLPQVGTPVKGGEIIKMLSSWRMDKPIDIEMTPVVIDGFLTINGDPVGRIAPKMPKPIFDDRAYYWEGKALAKAESDYD